MTGGVAFVSSHEYGIRGVVDTPPPCSALVELLHRLFPIFPVLRPSGNQVRHYLAVPGDGNGLSVLDHSW